jgi:DNA-directed RNA polymerase specialized sigma24 family protein
LLDVVASQPDMSNDHWPSRVGPADADIRAFVAEASRTLQRALVARNGVEDGCDAAAAAIAWAWEHQDELSEMANPVGYLYRVGQSSLRRDHRLRRLRLDLLPERSVRDIEGFDDELFKGLSRLTHDQRVAVVMVHMYSFTYREVAELMGVSETAVTNFVHRGLNRLRLILRTSGDPQ